MARRPSAAPSILLLLLASGCAWPSPERELLLNYFRACQVYDTTVLARLATAPCNPRADGVVQEFEMLSVEHITGAGAPARRVTIDALIRPADGSPASRTQLAVMLAQVEGRWMVAGVMPLRASRTSPAASSAPPK